MRHDGVWHRKSFGTLKLMLFVSEMNMFTNAVCDGKVENIWKR